MKRIMLGSVAICLLAAPYSLAGGKQDASPGKKFDVKVLPDLIYFGNDPREDRHKVDLYLPKGTKDFPVVFFVHGGGWTKGDRKKFDKLGTALASDGVGMVAISYRLTPQVQHPGHIEDVARAFVWTYRNIPKYGGNNAQIFVSGHSAGGHLAALLGTDSRYLKAHGLSLANIRGVIPISGVYKLEPGKRENIFGKDPEAIRQASPIAHVSKSCPPFLILYAEKDGKDFDKMAENFSAALKKNGVEASVREMKDRTHATIVYNAHQPGDPTLTVMLDFIRRHTSGNATTGRRNEK